MLRFTEPVEASSSGIVLLAPGGVLTLAPRRDASDVKTLVAELPALVPGGYRVQWRTLSADGHPVDGSFVFYVADGHGMTGPAPAERVLTPPSSSVPRLVAAGVRGLGVGALAALGGLLVLSLMFPAAGERRVQRWMVLLSAAAAVLLAAHAVVWAVYARGSGDEPLRTLLTATSPGRVEVVRASLGLLAMWALALARRPGLALAFVATAVAVSGFAGHSLAIHPTWSVPAKALHVAAVAVWLGGLTALSLTVRDGSDFQVLALRVSSLSLAAVLALAVTGAVQTLLFAPSLALLVRSAYGAVLGVKLAGTAVLVGMGARNRFRVIPRLPAGDARLVLRRSVAGELIVMTVVLLAAGLLAYIPAPRPAEAHPHHHEMNP